MRSAIKKKMAAWLSAHNPACPICQNRDWRIPPDFFRLSTGNKDTPDAPELLTIAFCCEACGYIFFVDPGAMGVKGLSP